LRIKWETETIEELQFKVELLIKNVKIYCVIMEIHLIFQIQNIYNIQKLMKNNNDRKITVPSQLKQKKRKFIIREPIFKKTMRYKI
jgi:hypothetical protein